MAGANRDMEMKGFGLDDVLIRPGCDRNLENLCLHADRGNALHGFCDEGVKHRLFVPVKSTTRWVIINKCDVPDEPISSEFTSFKPEINREGCK